MLVRLLRIRKSLKKLISYQKRLRTKPGKLPKPNAKKPTRPSANAKPKPENESNRYMKHIVSELRLKNKARGLLVHIPDASVMTFEINFRAGEYLVKPDKWETPHLM